MPTSAASLHPFVYLASQSPRRQELLQQVGVRFELLLPRPDEDAEALEAELPGERAHDYVQRVCVAKARAARARLVAGGHVARPILVADTTVTIDDTILGKPLDADDAAAMGFDLDEIEPPRGDSDEELLSRMVQKLPPRH